MNQKKNKEDQAAYMRQWREKNKDRLRRINRRYYLRNKGYLNKTRSRPWTDDNVLNWLRRWNENYIRIMIRILRPYKDKLIGLKSALDNKDDA